MTRRQNQLLFSGRLSLTLGPVRPGAPMFPSIPLMPCQTDALETSRVNIWPGSSSLTMAYLWAWSTLLSFWSWRSRGTLHWRTQVGQTCLHQNSLLFFFLILTYPFSGAPRISLFSSSTRWTLDIDGFQSHAKASVREEWRVGKSVNRTDLLTALPCRAMPLGPTLPWDPGPPSNPACPGGPTSPWSKCSLSWKVKNLSQKIITLWQVKPVQITDYYSAPGLQYVCVCARACVFMYAITFHFHDYMLENAH